MHYPGPQLVYPKIILDSSIAMLYFFIDSSGGSITSYWVGGNDLATHNRWVWASTGYRIYPFANWAKNKPSGPGRLRMFHLQNNCQVNWNNLIFLGHCMSVESDTFEWVNLECSKLGYFFCEKSKFDHLPIWERFFHE